MFDELLTASPPARAYVAQPMSVAEIDAHPDSVRIWATIHATREAVSRDLEGRDYRRHMQGAR